MLNDVMLFLASAELVIAGAVVLLACVVVLATSKKREISMRTTSAVLVAFWSTLLIAQSLGDFADWFVWSDQIGILGIALWAGNAIWKFRGKVITRATDWGELDGKETATTRHASLDR